MRAIRTPNQNWFWQNTTINIPINTRVHVAVTFDGTTVRSYKDGVLVNTYTGYPSEGISNDNGCLTL